MEKKIRDKIRTFNRFYTKILGVLNHQYLGSPYSLPETRVIQEIQHHPSCAANDIAKALNIDKGYLSRLLRKFEQRGYLVRKESSTDRRREELTLTPAGIEVFQEINSTADKSIEEMCDGLDANNLNELVVCMERIHTILTHKKS